MNNELSQKNKWGFSVGCVGRDLTYTLVSLFFLTFIQYTCGLTSAQFTVLSVIIILCRVWDAVNDPMMSTIITNTKSKFGRYQPWILIGSIVNTIFLILLFITPGLHGWGYVAYLGVCYLLWGMTFTMNDVAYWSMIPHLARSKDNRDKLTGLVAIFASVGQFVAGGLVPFLSTGNQVQAYRLFAIIFGAIFVACQVMVFLVVKDKDNGGEHQKNITLKEMFKIIFHNKQLLVMAVVVLLYSLGSALLTSFGTNFFYFKFGYNGIYMTIFTVIFAVGTLIAQFVFGVLAKKYKRAQLVKFSTILMVVGYFIFFALANMPVSWFGNNWIYLGVISLFGCLIFFGQGLFYLTMLIMLTNTIEYDEWQTGVRNEAVSFSVRPFMVKLSSALQQGLLTLFLVITGLYSITQGISTLEAEIPAGTASTEEVTAAANELLKGANAWQIFGLTVGMCLIPVILYIIEYVLIKKKYIIDEEKYDEMIKEIDERKAQKQNEQKVSDNIQG